MGYKADVRTLNAAMGVSVDTAANWGTVNPILPKGLLALASDSGVIKIGDGVLQYNALPVRIDATLTQAQRTMLDNVNLANGLVKLDSTGVIPMALMPTGVVSGAVKFVADIAARNALTGDDRNGMIVVIDATGDATVTLGTAQYVWNGTAWEKIGERESLDINLVPYFHTGTDTLDRITDGTNYVRFTPAERAALASVVAQAVRKGATLDELVDSATYVRMLATERTDLSTLKSNAVRYTDVVFVAGFNATAIAAMYE